MASGLILSGLALGYLAVTQPAAGHTLAADISPTVHRTSTPRPRLRPTPTPVPSPPPPPPVGGLPRQFANPAVDGLITNEYAFYNAGDPAAAASPDFEMTSGSLYGRGGDFWTGNPNACEPDASSGTCNNSDIFRLNTKQRFQGNVSVSLALMQLSNITNPSCNSNDSCWYGTHLWLRYQSEYNLYYASVNRADGQVVIKRKVPCGSDNDGTYFVLGTYVPHAFKPNAWNHYRASIQTNADNSVTIKLYDTDASAQTPVVTGTDRGGTNPNWNSRCSTPGKYGSANYSPITDPGGVGIRGDFSNFVFRDLTVSTF
jgi:hypothetical protein